MPDAVTPAITKEDKFANIFDQLISKNYMTKDVMIDGIKFTIKTLSSSEYLDADSIYIATLPYIPQDVISRARMISNLAYAIISINDIPVYEEGCKPKEKEKAIHKLYEHLRELPPAIIDVLAKELNALLIKQSDIMKETFDSPGKAKEAIENF